MQGPLLHAEPLSSFACCRRARSAACCCCFRCCIAASCSAVAADLKMLFTFRWNFPMGATGADGAGAGRGAGGRGRGGGRPGGPLALHWQRPKTSSEPIPRQPRWVKIYIKCYRTYPAGQKTIFMRGDIEKVHNFCTQGRRKLASLCRLPFPPFPLSCLLVLGLRLRLSWLKHHSYQEPCIFDRGIFDMCGQNHTFIRIYIVRARYL